jgi:selenocysteine lyase/cysteine desulfurase
MDARDLVAALAKQNINSVVSLREFGQIDFASKGVETAIRLSPHYYNTEGEVETTIAAVRDFVRQ